VVNDINSRAYTSKEGSRFPRRVFAVKVDSPSKDKSARASIRVPNLSSCVTTKKS